MSLFPVHRALGAVLLLGTACTSVYMPRRPQVVSLTMESGSLAIVRNGRVHPVGLLGGGMTDALGDLPLASEFAATYQQRATVGLLTMIAGGVALVATPTLALTSRDDSSASTAAIVAAGGLAAYVLGAGLLASAQPYLYDAVNAANDELGLPPSPSPSGP